jgi:hypothetical protein
MEQVEIQPGRSNNATTGLRLLSFRGQRVRITQSVLGPGDREKKHIHTTILTHEDHGIEIVFKVANFGRIPFMILQGSCIGQVMLVGVDDVVCQIGKENHAEICSPATACEVDTDATTDDVRIPGRQHNPKKYKKPWVGHQSRGARNNQVV